MSLQIVPFTQDHLDAAAHLAAARYALHKQPSWPARYADPGVLLPRLKEALRTGLGVAALRADQLAGFLLAFPHEFRDIRTAYIPDFAHGTVPEDARRIYRTLYAAFAPQWLAYGCFQHAISLFTGEQPGIDAWFSLGFGLFVVDALRGLEPVSNGSASIDIRRATLDDLDLVESLEIDLRRHLASAPVFIPLIIDEGREDRVRWLEDEAKSLWLAFQDGEPVAHMCFEPSEHPVLPVSDDSIVAVTGAYTRPQTRGAGIATALLDRGLAWARDLGYQQCSVDFESANIPGAGFWQDRAGFRPVCHSLLRRVDERLAWAGTDRAHTDVRRAYQGRIGLG